MLKFRVTNSVKARRAAEAQRRALEEKLEWAWKPLAAMMNENSTDLVYWIPPLYNSNVVAASSKSAVTPRQGSVRKKKLSSSRRRPKLAANDSITEEMEEDGVTVKEDDYSTFCPDNSSIVGESLPDDDEWESQDDNESGIHEETVEKPLENEITVVSQDMETGIESDKKMSDIDKEILMHNALLHNTPVVVQSNTNKPKKLTSSPTLLKILDKLSHLHGLPGIMHTKNKDNEVKDVNESKKHSNKKNKRPSVRVYQRHSQRSSTRSHSSLRSNNKSNEEEIVITAEPFLSAKPSIKRVNSKQPKCDETESGIFDQSDTDNEETTSNMENIRNAQLQMMLRILSQLYEDKLTRQETELEHLRTRVQTQEKLMKQLVHVTMDLKADMDKLKKSQKLGNDIKAVNEKLKKIDQEDNNQSSDSTSNKKVSTSQKPPILPKPNVLTIKIGEK